MRHLRSSIRLRLLASLAMLAIAGLAASPAAALSITPDPIAFNVPLGGGAQNLIGQVDFVGMTTGVPVGGTVQDGTIGASDTTLIFSLTVDPTSDAGITTLNFPFITGSPTVTGSGTIAGSGVDVTGTAFGVAEFDNGFGVDPGESSDAWFVSLSDLEVGDQIKFQFVVIDLGVGTVVPEPGTAMLLLTGLGLLAHRRRR